MKINLNSTFTQLKKYSLVTTLSTRPFLYYGLRQIIGAMDYLCVDDKTELAIEGYPRSAKFTEILQNSPSFQKRLNEANTLYQRFIDLHERHH